MNTQKTKFLLGGIISILAIVTLGVVDRIGPIENRIFAEQPEPYSITFNTTTNKIGTDPFAFGQFYSGTGEVRTGLNNPVSFQYADFANPTNMWQTIKAGGYFTNTEPIMGMTSISIEKNNTSANIGVYWSNTTSFDASRYQVFDTSTPLNVSTDFSGYQPNYIKVVALGASNSSIKSAKIDFSCSNLYPSLTLTNANPSMGTVSGSGVYQTGSSVTINATPNSGYQFTGWYQSSALVSSSVSYSFTMPYTNLTYVARFSTNTYELTLASDNSSKGTVSGAGTYAYGSEVTITATPIEGNAFIGWFNGSTLMSANAIYIFNMPYNALSYTAKFVTKYHVDVISGDETMGTVSGSGDFGYTTSVTITATPLEGHYFVAWYDEDFNRVTNANPYTFSMPESSVSYYAKFINDIYTLGSYPQTKVTDSTLISTLNTAGGTLPTSANSQTWTSYRYYISGSNATNFMWYQDVTSGGDKYRGVYFTSYRPNYTTTTSSTSNSFQDDNGYKTGTCYWFKYEPIVWDVLSGNETGGALVIAQKILDSRDYYHSESTRLIAETIYANNYEESNIRRWLNNDFYNQAFSATEQSLINTTAVDNSSASTGYTFNSYARGNTSDKLFLLSYADVTNAFYGFDSDASRMARQATDYAKAMGARIEPSVPNPLWWLRSPDYRYDDHARGVSNGGDFNTTYVCSTYYGVLPAFRINL